MRYMAAVSFSLKELAEQLGLKFSGNGDLQITHVCGLDSLQAGGLAYLTSPDGLTSVPTPAGMSRHVETTVDEINSSKVALVVSPDVQHPEHNLITQMILWRHTLRPQNFFILQSRSFLMFP